jgi:hypothetical protein
MNFLGASDEHRQGARRPHLRLLRGGSRPAHPPARPGEVGRGAVEHPHANATPATGASPERARILIAGADSGQRAVVRRELTEALPTGTEFGEAGAGWEVLEQAPSSGVVMLAGDLAEVTAESLMHVLGHRHPSLPVVALGLLANAGPAVAGDTPRAASAAG